MKKVTIESGRYLDPARSYKEQRPARYRADCPVCDYFAVRSKREAAVHIVTQHVAYAHDGVEVTR